MFPPQETLRSDEQNKLFELLNLAKTKLKLKGRVKRNKKIEFREMKSNQTINL